LAGYYGGGKIPALTEKTLGTINSIISKKRRNIENLGEEEATSIRKRENVLEKRGGEKGGRGPHDAVWLSCGKEVTAKGEKGALVEKRGPRNHAGEKKNGKRFESREFDAATQRARRARGEGGPVEEKKREKSSF